MWFYTGGDDSAFGCFESLGKMKTSKAKTRQVIEQCVTQYDKESAKKWWAGITT